MKKLFEGSCGFLNLHQPYYSLLGSFRELNEYESQNGLIMHACADLFGFVPYAIARDKRGDILVITNEDERGTDGEVGGTFFGCYVMGLNQQTGKFNLYRVGTLEYGYSFYPSFHMHTNADGRDIKPNALSLHQIGVHPKFEGLGIGKVLLQVAENYAAENHMDALKLSRLLHYVRRTGTRLPRQLADIETELIHISHHQPSKLEHDPEAISFIMRSYFDKNHYFYTTNGFMDFEEQNPNPIQATPMLKTNLKRMRSYYGLDSGAYKIEGGTTNPRFTLERLEPEDALWVLSKTFMSPSLFKQYVNRSELSDLTILGCPPSPEATAALKKLLNSHGGERYIPYTFEQFTKENISKIIASGLSEKPSKTDDTDPGPLQ